ncbi:MAG: SRPBCC family protein [Cryobacterium sp.]
MARVIENVDVNVPIDVAYSQWTQFESFPHFLAYVKSVERLDDTRTHWTVKISGVEREFDAVITDKRPDERVAWTSTSGDLDHTGVITFHRLDIDETRVTVQLDWSTDGLAEKLGAALGIDDHVIKKDLKQFKSFVENPLNRDGGWRGDVTL